MAIVPIAAVYNSGQPIDRAGRVKATTPGQLSHSTAEVPSTEVLTICHRLGEPGGSAVRVESALSIEHAVLTNSRLNAASL